MRQVQIEICIENSRLKLDGRKAIKDKDKEENNIQTVHMTQDILT